MTIKLINDLAMQLPEDGTCINRLIKNEFFVPFMKLLNCMQSLFPIFWKSNIRLYGNSFMFWIISIELGPKYFLKMYISVNISDLRISS